MKSKILLLTSILAFGCGNSNKSDNIENENIEVVSEPKIEKPKAKLEIFNNVEKVQGILSKNGIGNLRNWHGDELGFMSATNYFSFGSNSPKNGMQNNLAYYLESENSNYIKTIELVLNINNSNQKKQAIEKFKKTAEQTFKSLSIEIPIGLLKAISNNKKFNAENSNFSTILELEKSNIDTWKLTIETK